MKKIIGLTIAAIIVLALAGISTYAYFSDTEESANNVFTAGTLDLGLADASETNPTGTVNAVFSADDWAPGATVSDTLYVNNEGSIAMSALTIDFDYGDITGTAPADIDAGTDTLDNMISISDATFNDVDVTGLIGKTLAEIKTGSPVSLPGSLAANSELPLALTFAFGDADNGCQGKSIDVTVIVAGAQ